MSAQPITPQNRTLSPMYFIGEVLLRLKSANNIFHSLYLLHFP